MEPTEYDVLILSLTLDEVLYETIEEETACEPSAGTNWSTDVFSETLVPTLSSPASLFLSPALLYSNERLWAEAEKEKKENTRTVRKLFQK